MFHRLFPKAYDSKLTKLQQQHAELQRKRCEQVGGAHMYRKELTTRLTDKLHGKGSFDGNQLLYSDAATGWEALTDLTDPPLENTRMLASMCSS